uniref:coiled-coil domain-containing protein 138 isoform X2 n=1 Tax=Jaculus jaculus TaxID=51337 RepID=UPI001E1B0C0B|nr:coiled-coil domain-containing protein 138 isoform X2 [Jaculus jaculus]
MEPRVVKPPGQDLVVERLKSRYGLAGRCSVQHEFSNFDQAKYKSSLTSPDYLDIYCSGDKVVSSLRCYSDERKHYTTPFCSSFKHLNVTCLDDELDYLHDWKKQETEELIKRDHKDTASKITKQSLKDTEKVALPSRPGTECCNDGKDFSLQHVTSPKCKVSSKQSLLPHQINQIYDELFHIHLKLQCETTAQQKFAEELKKREHFLVEREKLLFRHENALSKIKGVEEEVLTKFQIIKEQHDAEIEHLTETLKEKNKESKRLRSSFDTLKELNDNLRKQLNEVSEENRKMEIQAKKVQARLDNLQVPLNGQVYELIIVFMDWISDHHLSKVKHDESDMDGDKPLLPSSQRNDIQEKCVKLLPLMTEQLQWMPFVNVKLHEPFVKFIYWSLRQLDAGTQHSTMTSTLRRLGEDIFKGVVIKGIQDNSSENSIESKPKTAAFFKSSSLSLRFLSTLIVLKTVTQADYLAQAFDSLCLDLKTDEGKTLFLEYQAVPVILSHLRISSKGLLSNVIDSLLQMTVESKSLQPFLEACSNSLFFRTCSVLLRTPKLDLHILEKLSIILQKLSKIKSNKKLFELFTIHLMLQEIQRTTHPEHAFLCINLNSTLFNLGLTKCSSLVSNASH